MGASILNPGSVDFAGANFDIKLRDFRNTVGRHIRSGEAKLRQMEDDGWDRNPAHTFEYDECRRMTECYADLYGRNPKDDRELEALIWLFNGGKLRPNAEIEAKREELEKAEYREKDFSGKLFQIHLFADKRRLMCLLLSIALAPVVPIAVWRFVHQYWRDLPLWPFLCMIVVSWPISILLTHLIVIAGDARDEMERFEEYKKAGEKYRPSTEAVVDAAFYGATLLATRNIRRRTGRRRR